MTLFTLLICCSRKKGFRRLFTFTIKSLTYTYVPEGLAHLTHSASLASNRKTQRSLVRGRGTSVDIILSVVNIILSIEEISLFVVETILSIVEIILSIVEIILFDVEIYLSIVNIMLSIVGPGSIH